MTGRRFPRALTDLRTIVFWLHLASGVVAGAVILVMSVTGTLLTFQQQVLLRIERAQRLVVEPGPSVVRLDADTLIDRARAAVPGAQPTGLTLESSRTAAATVALGAAGNVYVNPYTGEVLGSGSIRARAFYRSVTAWHRYLSMTGDRRAVGRAITGACNAAFLVLAMSGLYLWWPRQWTWRHVAPVLWFRRRLRGRARDFNWHNAIGFWCAPVLVVLTASGMVISYAWAGNLVYTLTGSQRPAPAASQTRPPATIEAAAAGPAVPLETLVREAGRHLPTWRTIALRLPARSGTTATATISDTAHWNAFARSTLTIDVSTGNVVQWDPYDSISRGQKVRGWLRFAHTGELGGVAGEAVAGLASLGGAFLVWTGLALAIRRLAAWRARRQSDTVRARAA
jgi:uncharacterized iron-regulated membrane protein